MFKMVRSLQTAGWTRAAKVIKNSASNHLSTLIGLNKAASGVYEVALLGHSRRAKKTIRRPAGHLADGKCPYNSGATLRRSGGRSRSAIGHRGDGVPRIKQSTGYSPQTR